MLKIVFVLFLALGTSLAGRAQSHATIQDGESTLKHEADTVSRSKAAAAAPAHDVNGDGVVNAIDIVDIVKYVKGSPRSVFKKAKADVNGDGVVDIKDAQAMSVDVVGKESPISGNDPGSNPGNNTGNDNDDDTGTGTGTGTGLDLHGGSLTNPEFSY